MDEPRAERPRILIEHPSSLVVLDLVDEFERAGFDVETCRGPTHLEDGRCPLVAGEGCERAAGVDVILNALGPQQLQVYAAQRAVLSDIPVCVEVSDDGLQRLAGALADVRRSGPIPTGTALLERVREVLASRPPHEDA